MMINKLSSIEFFRKNNIFLIFTLLKYVEYVISAYLFFSIARVVSPSEYGTSSSSFLIVTYSSFIVLGVNQVLVKWYSKSNSHLFRIFLIRYTIFYNFIFSILSFILISLVSGKDYGLSISIICSFRLLIECIVTIFRVKNRTLLINVIYIFTSLTFLFLYKLLVINMVTFFEVWSYSIILGLIFSIILYIVKESKTKSITYNKFKYYLVINNSRLFYDGLKLTLISIISTLILSIDRILFINIYDLPKKELGNIQLADNISNVINLGFGSILFVITPKVISSIYKKKIIDQNFYLKGYAVFFIIFLFLIIFYFPLLCLVNYIFPNYKLISYPLFIYTTIKLLNLSLFMPSILSMVYSKENLYLKTGIKWIFIFLLVLYIIHFFKININLFYFLPFSIVFMLIVIHINLGIIFLKNFKT